MHQKERLMFANHYQYKETNFFVTIMVYKYSSYL